MVADNTTQSGSDTIATDDVTTLNGAGSSGVKVQRVKVAFGDDGTARDASAAFPLPVTQTSASLTPTITAPSIAATSFTVLASNSSRRMCYIMNDSSVTVYLALAATASTTSYTVQLVAGMYYELPVTPGIYTGIITGIALTASGNLRVTELV